MAVAHKGSISMGLVLIPVGLYKTTVDNDIHFNQLDKESRARIKYSHLWHILPVQEMSRRYGYIQKKSVRWSICQTQKIPCGRRFLKDSGKIWCRRMWNSTYIPFVSAIFQIITLYKRTCV